MCTKMYKKFSCLMFFSKDQLGQDMYDAIKALYGTEFTFGQGGQTICKFVT